MNNQVQILLILTAFTFLFSHGVAGEERPELIIRNKLLEHYQVAVDSHEIVHLDMLFLDVHLNEYTRETKVDLYIHLAWVDYQLVWNAEQFNNIHKITIGDEEIWMPEIVTLLEKMPQRGNPIGKKFVNNVLSKLINNDGTVEHEYTTSLTMKCETDTENWPLDTQYCYLRIGSSFAENYTLISTLIDSRGCGLKTSCNPIGWDMQASLTQKPYNQSEPIFKDIVTIEVTFNRKGFMYTTVYLPPAFIIMIITLVVLSLKPQDPNRLIMLGVFVPIQNYLLNYSIYIPHSGYVVPKICKCIAVISVITTFCIVETIIIRVLSKSTTNSVWLYINDQISKMNLTPLFFKIHRSDGNVKLEENETDQTEEEISDYSPTENEENKEERSVETAITFLDGIVFLLVASVYLYNSILLSKYI